MRAQDLPTTDDFDDEPTWSGHALPRARVLVVEDDFELRRLVSRRLERDGFDVYEASDGDEAIRGLGLVGEPGWPADGFELVLLDNRMPGTSGLDMLRLMRAEHDTTPALMMTAFPDATLIEQAGQCGAAVLAKPFTLDQLCDATIAAITRTRRPLRPPTPDGA